MPIEIKRIQTDELYQSIVRFVEEGQYIIGDYDDMKDVILKMIRAGYAFDMDRERLRDAMEDITYMLCPEDDVNKDRVVKGLEYEESSDSDDEYPPDLEDGPSIEEITSS